MNFPSQLFAFQPRTLGFLVLSFVLRKSCLHSCATAFFNFTNLGPSATFHGIKFTLRTGVTSGHTIMHLHNQARYRTQKSASPPRSRHQWRVSQISRRFTSGTENTAPIRRESGKGPCLWNLPMTLPTLALSTVRVTTGGRRSDTDAS